MKKIFCLIIALLCLGGCAYLNNGEWPDTQVGVYGHDRYVWGIRGDGTKYSYESHSRSRPGAKPFSAPTRTEKIWIIPPGR